MDSNLRWVMPDKTILILTVSEYWTWEEMRQWIKDIGEVLDTCDEPVTVMLDFQYSTYFPKNGVLVIPSIIENIHEKADPILFVRLSPTHRVVMSVIKSIHRNIAHKISILEDVDEMLQQM